MSRSLNPTENSGNFRHTKVDFMTHESLFFGHKSLFFGHESLFFGHESQDNSSFLRGGILHMRSG